MDRIFLDANILLSAAYEPNALLQVFWKLKDVTLCSSQYAVQEARENLGDEAQKNRLAKLLWRVELFDAEPGGSVGGVTLPEKDVPILLAAIEARASHLVTGDRRHFAPFYRRKIEGVMICSVKGYLRRRK